MAHARDQSEHVRDHSTEWDRLMAERFGWTPELLRERRERARRFLEYLDAGRVREWVAPTATDCSPNRGV